MYINVFFFCLLKKMSSKVTYFTAQPKYRVLFHMAQTYLLLPLQQWGAGNVYLWCDMICCMISHSSRCAPWVPEQSPREHNRSQKNNPLSSLTATVFAVHCWDCSAAAAAPNERPSLTSLWTTELIRYRNRDYIYLNGFFGLKISLGLRGQPDLWGPPGVRPQRTHNGTSRQTNQRP